MESIDNILLLFNKRAHAPSAGEKPSKKGYSVAELKVLSQHPERIALCDCQSPDPLFYVELQDQPFMVNINGISEGFISQKSNRRVQEFGAQQIFEFGQIWDGHSVIMPKHNFIRGRLSSELIKALGDQNIERRLQFVREQYHE